MILRVTSPTKMSAPIDLEKVFVREIDKNNDSVLKIYQSEIGDVGCVVWDAALVLSKYLETADFDYGRGLGEKSVLELGAGTGVVGLMAASCGARVTITDLPEFVPLMQLNAETNKSLCKYPVQTEALRWGDDVSSELASVDLILVADCIYYEESLEPLVKTITDLSNQDTCVFCCYEERTTGDKPRLQKTFFQLISRNFHIEEIPHDRQDQHYHSNDIHIMKFTRLKS